MILLVYLKHKVKIRIHATKIYKSAFTFSNKKVKKVEKIENSGFSTRSARYKT